MTNECMCCGMEIVDVSPEVELCMECYEDVVVTDEEIEAIELALSYENGWDGI